MITRSVVVREGDEDRVYTEDDDECFGVSVSDEWVIVSTRDEGRILRSWFPRELVVRYEEVETG